PTAISGIPQGPMVLTVSQKNNRERETLLRPAARRISRRAAFRLLSEMSLALSRLASDEGGKFIRVEWLLALPEPERHGGQPTRQRQARHLGPHAFLNPRLRSEERRVGKECSARWA